MASEDKVHTTERDKVLKKSAESGSPEPTLLDSWLEIQRLKRESALAPDEPEYEVVEMTDEQMEALSDEELDAHIDLHEKQVKLDELQKELDRRALNMGLLKLANKAPRCSRCRAEFAQQDANLPAAKAMRGVTPRRFRGNAVENSGLPRGRVGVAPGLKEALSRSPISIQSRTIRKKTVSKVAGTNCRESQSENSLS